MINVVFFKKSSEILGFEVKGHAFYADSGSDIVCAAVSALALTCVGGIKDVLKLKHTCTIKGNGYVYIMLDNSLEKESIEKANILFSTIEEGLKSISTNYPKNVLLSESEV